MKILVTGGANGLGAAIIDQLTLNFRKAFFQDDNEFFSLDKYYDDEPAVQIINGVEVNTQLCDLTDEDHIIECVKEIGDINILVNCAGINDIDYLENLAPASFDELMAVNAKAIYLTAKHFLEGLTKNNGTILNIVSNASHMPMTASLAYNASKGAAHIMTLQLARELTKKNGVTVFGISPNKLNGTEMSGYIDERVPIVRGWSKEFAQEYQLNSLLTGEETDPYTLAEFIAFLLSSKERHKYLSGCILPYGA